MSVVPNKYRGTTQYNLVKTELIMAARYKGTVTYKELAYIAGLPLRGNYMSAEIGHLLGEISEDEHVSGRPMLSAIAVRGNGIPGSGFFDLAIELDKLHDNSEDSKRLFFENEKEAVYETWQSVIRET